MLPIVHPGITDMGNKKSTRFTSCLSWGISLVIASSYVFLSFQHDLRLSLPILMGASAVVICLLTVLVFAGENGKIHISAGTVLLLAAFFRLLFLFTPPQLSDDVYRYLWDGLQTLLGTNPYGLAPGAAEPTDEACAALLQEINHPQYVTVYPPVSQLVFAVGAAISNNIAGLKALLIMLDLGVCLIILKLLRARGLPAWRSALYAWHPLPIIEISGSGHIDGTGILFFLTAVWLLYPSLRKCRLSSGSRTPIQSKQIGGSFLAGIIFAASVLTKFIPLMYLPVLLASTGKPLRLAAGFLAGLVVISIPFMPELLHMFITLGIFLNNWEFSNFAFHTLRSLTSSGDHARLIMTFLFMACMLIFTVSFLIGRKENDVHGQFMSFMKAAYGITMCFILLTPTLHPWYALSLVGLFPFITGPAGLVLSWSVFLSYHVLIGYALFGTWVENDLIAAAVWLSPITAGLLSFIAGRLKRESRIPCTGGYAGAARGEHIGRT